MLFLCICSIDAFRLSSQFTFWNLFIYGMDGGNSIPRCDRATESAMEFSKGIANPRTNKRTNELSRWYSFCILLLPYHTLHSFILYTMIISVYNAHVFSAASLFLEPRRGEKKNCQNWRFLLFRNVCTWMFVSVLIFLIRRRRYCSF